MKILSRQEVQKKGLTRYFTGKACARGHIAERRVSDRKCVLCAKNKMRKWKTLNPERMHGFIKNWRVANPEKTRAIRVRYHKRHPYKNREWVAARRARKSNAKGRYENEDIRLLFKKQKGLCVCTKRLGHKYHVDHKTPLSRGGSNWPRNLQLLCAFCNDSKGAKTQAEWLRCK